MDHDGQEPPELREVLAPPDNSATGRVVGALLLLTAIGAGAWRLVDYEAWHFRGRPTDYLTALGPVATLATAAFTATAAVAALIYAGLTYQLLRQGHRAQLTTLMQQLMREYDELRDDIRTVQRFWKVNGARAIENFSAAKAAPDQTSYEMQDVDPARFRISRFFVKVRKLTDAGFLERTIIVAALDRASIDKVFLPFIDPLDQVIRAVAYGSGDSRDREFFTALLKDYDAAERRRKKRA